MASDAFISDADDLMNKLNSMTNDASKDIEFDDPPSEVDNKAALDISWASEAETTDEGSAMEEMDEDFSDEEEGESASTVKVDDDQKSVEEAPEKEIMDAGDLEQLLMETMTQKPKAHVGKITKVSDTSDIPVVPFKKPFVPTPAPKTVVGQLQQPLMARPSSAIKGYKKQFRRIKRNTGGKGKRKVRKYVNEDDVSDSMHNSSKYGKFKLDDSNPTAVSGDKFDENIGGYISDGETGQPTLFVNTFKDLDDEEAMKLWQRKISKAERLRREERNMANKLKTLGIQYHKEELKQDSPLNSEGRENRGSADAATRRNKNSPHQKTAHDGKSNTLLGWYEKYHMARFFKKNTLAFATGYILPMFILTVILFHYYGSPLGKDSHGMSETNKDETDPAKDFQLNFFHPLPMGSIGATQQPTVIVVDLRGYNDFLLNSIDRVDTKKQETQMPEGKFTVWIDGNETASERVSLPLLNQEKDEIYRWRAAVPQIMEEKKHLVQVVYEVNGIKFSNATTFTVVPDPPHARVSITSPAKGQVIALHKDESLRVEWTTDDFKIPRDGYLQIRLNDGGPQVQDYEADFVAQLKELSPGKHKFSVSLLSRSNRDKILHEDEVVFNIVEKESSAPTSVGELEVLKALSTTELEAILADEDLQLNSLRREMIEKILDFRWKESLETTGL